MNNIGKYGIHPIYMSMHCGIALIFSLRLFLSVKKKYEKLVLLFLNLMLFFFLLIYARKGPIIAFIITLVIVSYLDYRKYLKYNLLFVFGLTVTFFLIPTTRDRFLELTKIQKTTIDVTSSSNTRFEIYKNSFSLIKKSPFLGYGIGDYQEELDKVYQNNAPVLLNGVYNSHNQYLGFLLIGGVLLLFTFLFYLSHKFNLAFKTNNTLLLSILVFYSVMMLFENILERENGVIFFSFLINFFSLKKFYKK
ncbi:MAG: O-antigen ligase family protein [Polaribacter sp.]